MIKVTSLTPGSMSVDFDKTWVNTVARSMCQVVMNIGKGKSIDDNTALLNIICETKRGWIISAKLYVRIDSSHSMYGIHILKQLTIVQLTVIQNIT